MRLTQRHHVFDEVFDIVRHNRLVGKAEGKLPVLGKRFQILFVFLLLQMLFQFVKIVPFLSQIVKENAFFIAAILLQFFFDVSQNLNLIFRKRPFAVLKGNHEGIQTQLRQFSKCLQRLHTLNVRFVEMQF